MSSHEISWGRALERAFKKQVLGMNSPATLPSVPWPAVSVVGSVVSGERNGSFVIVEVKSVRPLP